MTPAAALLGYLRRGGYAVHADGDRLHVRPRERLTAAECEAVREHKAGLLAELADERWEWCRACPAAVDAGSAADVAAVCDRAECPYRGRG